MVTPVTATVPDVILSLEQINTSHGTWYAAIDLQMSFYPYLSIRSTSSNLLSAGKEINTSLLFYFRVYQLSNPMSYFN